VGYAWNTTYLTIKTGDFVKWSWSSPSNLLTGLAYKVEQVSDAASIAPSGFTSGVSSVTGILLFLMKTYLD
jgi:hypothetical protein